MSTGTPWALCSSSASSPSSPQKTRPLPKPKPLPPPPPPQGSRPYSPQLPGRPDHVGPSFRSVCATFYFLVSSFKFLVFQFLPSSFYLSPCSATPPNSPPSTRAPFGTPARYSSPASTP